MKSKQFFTFLLVLILIQSSSLFGQHILKPGFNKAEYIDLMKASAKFGSVEYQKTIPDPENYDFIYRSPIVGLENCWDLWVNKNHSVAVISIRGTTAESVSWLANIYAAMVPAKGELEFGNNEVFKYNLSPNPQAAVHIGWLISTAFLAKDILPKIDSCYTSGIKDVIVMGHSQGGGIGYLITSHLYNLQETGRLPKDIRIKTYGSASPKPGNLYYAYEYERLTQGGWSYNVVNSADWVPEVPISIQTVNDFNQTNPFTNAEKVIKQQKFPQRAVLKKMYKDMSKPVLKAQKNYQKYLGNIASKMVVKQIEGYKVPEYYNSNHYVRTGNTIVLYAGADYFEKFPPSEGNVFSNHFHPAYLYLANQLTIGMEPANEKTTPAMQNSLNGTWELQFILNETERFGELYKNKKPTIIFDLEAQRFSGNTSCNSYNGSLNIKGNELDFTDPIMMTKMFCEGGGEATYMKNLKGKFKYVLSDANTLTLNTLLFMNGDVVVMKYVRK